MLYLARLHGYVCGDGSANFYSYSYRKHPKAHLNIKIDDPTCLDKIIEAFAALDYSPGVIEERGRNGLWFTVQAQAGKIVREILSLGLVGSHKWQVPSFRENRLVREWVMAFFDSDGTVTCVNKEITLESVNGPGLNHLRKVLTLKFGVNSYLKYRKKRDTYLLRICGKTNLLQFYNKVGFHHWRKQEKLAFVLESYQRYYGNSWVLVKARKFDEARIVLMDIFRHRGYFRGRADGYGSFELGLHNSEAIDKIGKMLRRYFGIKCTISILDNQARSWVRISRRNELQKLLASRLLSKAPIKEAAIEAFLRKYMKGFFSSRKLN